MASSGNAPITPPSPGSAWPSWTAFRVADIRRIGPCEVEYGSRWQGARYELPWRLVWIEGTGEVVAVQWADTAEGGDAGPVRLLGVAPGREALDVALRDWWHMCGHVGSLEWVVNRLARSGLGPA
jgi:hypothetical protein